MQNNMHTLAIDEAKFKKTSKKIVSKLNEQYSLDLKLSSIQELLAESLGYRNLFALQKVFQEGEQEKSTNKVNLFKGLSSGQSTQLFINLMDNYDGMSMWKGRAISLISTMMMTLIYMKEQGELYFDVEGISDVQSIREYLILDNIIKLYKVRRDFPDHIRSALKAYLVSLPGFQESSPKQSDSVLEQHGYLQMQFSPILDKLAYIEKDNFVIANRNWFEPGRVTVKKELRDLDCIDISWLDMEFYQDWIAKALKKTEVIRISDLLSYTSMIISPHKRSQMCFVLNSILNNFDTASQISKEIESSI
jgi:virulence-associated protein VapD